MPFQILYAPLNSVDVLSDVALTGLLVAVGLSLLARWRPEARLWCSCICAALSAGIFGATLGASAISSMVDSDPPSWATNLIPRVAALAIFWAAVDLRKTAEGWSPRTLGMALMWPVLVAGISWGWWEAWHLLGRPLTFMEVEAAASLPDEGVCLWNGTPIVHRGENPPRQVLRGDALLCVTYLSPTRQTIHHGFPDLHLRWRQSWPRRLRPGPGRYALVTPMRLGRREPTTETFTWELGVREAPGVMVIQCFDANPRVVLFPPRADGPRRPYAVLNLRACRPLGP